MIKLNGVTLDCGRFPNGETYVDIGRTYPNFVGDNTVQVKFESNDDLLHLMMLKDFLDNSIRSPGRCYLEIPYLPYSRMDRQEENRLFSLKTVANLINNMKFDRVTIWEPHSDVSKGLLDRLEVINKSKDLALKAMVDELELVGSVWLTPASTYSANNKTTYDYSLEGTFRRAAEAGIWLVYPDAGADTRYKKQIKYTNIITATKHRDFNTGKIESTSLHLPKDIQDKGKFNTAIIVDDLCSRGGTFIGVGKELQKLGFTRIILAVTHCENTIFDGEIPQGKVINKVITSNSIQSNCGINNKMDALEIDHQNFEMKIV